MMSSEQKQLIEFSIQDLVAEIVKRENVTPDAAMDSLYHSRFFCAVDESRYRPLPRRCRISVSKF